MLNHLPSFCPMAVFSFFPGIKSFPSLFPLVSTVFSLISHNLCLHLNTAKVISESGKSRAAESPGQNKLHLNITGNAGYAIRLLLFAFHFCTIQSYIHQPQRISHKSVSQDFLKPQQYMPVQKQPVPLVRISPAVVV